MTRTDSGEATPEQLAFDAVVGEEYAHLGVGGDGGDGGARGEGEGQLTPRERAAGLSALCLSGGGIRSAAFALGVVTGLAKQGVLGRFHYLSTVSGGGYTGSWLSAWALRHRGGLAGVIAELEAHGDADGARDDGAGRRSPSGEGWPITFVRRYASYLSPRWGILSADTWTVIGIYLRNLLITAVVLVPLMGAGLMLPWLNYALLEATASGASLAGCESLMACLASGSRPAVLVFSLLFLSGALLAITVGAAHFQRVVRPEELDAPATGGSGDAPSAEVNGDARILGYFMVPGMLAFVVLTWVLSAVRLPWTELVVWGCMVTGAGTLIGFAVEWWLKRRSARAAAGAVGGASGPSSDPDARSKLLRKRALEFGAALLAGAGGGLLGHAVGERVLRSELARTTISRLFLRSAEAGGAASDQLPNIPGAESPATDVALEQVLAMAQATVGPLILVGVGLAACTAFVGLCSRATDTQDREYWARAGAWALIGMLVQVVFNAIALFGPILLDGALEDLGARNATLTAWGVISGLITATAGMSPSGGASGASARGQGWLKRVLDAGTAVAAPLFLLQVLVVIAYWNRWALRAVVDRFDALLSIPPAIVDLLGIAAWAIALLIFMGLAGWFINLNEFSLHGLYKVRLIRTFLGASRVFGIDRRRPNRFTGFDMRDDIPISTLAADRGRSKQPVRLFHVINMALNVGRGGELALQYRKALPFTVSALHAGYGMYLGSGSNEDRFADRSGHYRRTGPRPGSIDPWPEPAERDGKAKVDVESGGKKTGKKEREARYFGHRISLGTAMTISGAAASPNMGYHSSPVVTYLLTLLNARLGRWLGNTSDAGEKVFDHEHPGFSIRPILSEAFGLTSTKSPWIFLSDGGHFDNLGLYSMVARRCRYILVSDASGDPGYSWNDLARAVQLVRIDFGVDITFEEPAQAGDAGALGEYLLPEAAAKVGGLARRFRVGCIHYSKRYPGMEDGVVIVLKPVVTEADPVDIRNYRNRSKAFPHDSTAVQWYSEEQFEAYRKLGETTVAGLADFLTSTQGRAMPSAECARLWLEKEAGRPGR